MLSQVPDKGRLVTVLNQLGLEIRMDSFQNRLRLQKTVYLLKEFGLDLGYSFGWYIRGPYSPILADDLFACVNKADYMQAEDTNASNITSNEKEKIQLAVERLGDPLKNERFLELLASVRFWGKKSGKLSENEKKEIVKIVSQFKPEFQEDEINKALDFLNSLRI